MNNNIDNNDYTLPFSNYIENMLTKLNKFAIVITKSQYAIMTDGLTHEGMVSKLIKKTRPDIKTDDWGNALNPAESYNNDNIIIMGYPYYMLIALPQEGLLSNEQFEELKNLLLEIKDFNEINKSKGYGRNFTIEVYGGTQIKVEYSEYQNKIDELIKILTNYVQEETIISKEEVIIGEAIRKESKIK